MSSLIGQSLGRYQVLEQLGEGGMATVYKAFDTLLERFVAIKVIRTDQFAPSMLAEMMKRFEREAKALAKLSHPNIVHVHDYGEFEGAPYLVMEYLPSGTLEQRPAAPIPWQQALHFLLPIAEALAYAHAHNIIHRDIKPANILLTENGLPMLSDFGIAKILESNTAGTLTGAGVSIGTPEYMAPEQWTGQAGPQSDIYSLGVVLYELITGHKPYTGDTPVGIMLKQVKDPLPAPSQYVPDLPKELENILVKALERQPEDRFQTMSDFVTALESLASGQTLASGMKVEDLQSGKPIPAAIVSSQEAELATVFASAEKKPAARLAAEVPIPPVKSRHAPILHRRWIPVAGLGVLLFIGIVAGAGLVIKGLKGQVPLTVLPTVTLPSTMATAPNQLLPQVPASLSAALPTPGQTAALTTPAPEIKVLWDISHGPRTSGNGSLYTPDGMYTSLVRALGNKKFVITSGDLSNLNSYDILVLSAASASKIPYSSVEADKIEQFVRVSGHGLLILSDTPEFENLADTVARRFSISLGELNSDGPVSYSSEPFFSGVTSVQYLNQGGTFLVSSPSQTAALDKGGNSVIAFCACDAGRVMAIADANLWDNQGLSQADNQLFATDVFQWLAKLSQ